MIALSKFYGNYTLKWVLKGIQRGEKREKRDSEEEAMKWTEKYQLSEKPGDRKFGRFKYANKDIQISIFRKRVLIFLISMNNMRGLICLQN